MMAEKTWAERLQEKIARATYRLPRICMPVTFDQQPNGPFTLFTTPDNFYEQDMTLEEAVAAFVRYGYPPNDEGKAVVFDADGVVTLAWWIDNPETMHEKWYGLAAGFDQLATHPQVDPLQLQLGRLQAEEAPWG